MNIMLQYNDRVLLILDFRLSSTPNRGYAQIQRCINGWTGVGFNTTLNLCIIGANDDAFVFVATGG